MLLVVFNLEKYNFLNISHNAPPPKKKKKHNTNGYLYIYNAAKQSHKE